jgi:hypothetical protein
MAKRRRKKSDHKKSAPKESKCITEMGVEELAIFLNEFGEREDTLVRETLYEVAERLKVLASGVTPNILTRLRDAGWQVAGCQDKSECGMRSVRRLMLHPEDHRYVSGGGHTDQDALEMIALQLGMMENANE